MIVIAWITSLAVLFCFVSVIFSHSNKEEAEVKEKSKRSEVKLRLYDLGIPSLTMVHAARCISSAQCP